MKHDLKEDEKFRQQAEKLDVQWIHQSIWNNYRKIYAIIQKEEIPFLAMQYPLRYRESLSSIFEKGTDIIFISNRNSFRRGIEKDSYRKYFTDRFAGDFGHLTREGNELMADNLINQYFSKVLK